MRRIGVLMSYDENDPEVKHRVSAFTQALAGLGWAVGGNVHMDLRGARGDINRARALHPPRRPGGAIESAFIRHVG